MEHKLKSKSSFIVVVLATLRHGACVRCGKQIHSLDESSEHWKSELAQDDLKENQQLKKGKNN